MDIGERLIRLSCDEQVALRRHDYQLPVSELPALKKQLAYSFAQMYVRQIWTEYEEQAPGAPVQSQEAARVQQILEKHRYNVVCSMIMDILSHEIVEEFDWYLVARQRLN